VTLSFFKQ